MYDAYLTSHRLSAIRNTVTPCRFICVFFYFHIVKHDNDYYSHLYEVLLLSSKEKKIQHIVTREKLYNSTKITRSLHDDAVQLEMFT